MRCIYDGIHPCGKCPACLANRQRAFCFRLDQEKETSSFYFWLTLQYDDDHVPRFPDGEMCFSKQHCHKFFEKLRSRYKKDNITFKHFLVSEYGPNGTHRPHYHCLLLVYANDRDLSELYLIKREMRDFICDSAWQHGFVCEKPFHGKVITYLTKYCLKPELLGEYHTMKPFTLISHGIGLSFLDRLPEDQKNRMIENLDFTYRYNGNKIQLSRYYVDRLIKHTKQDLRDSMPSNPLGDWSEYQQIELTRNKMQKKNYALGLKNAKKRIWKETFDERKSRIDFEMSKFRAKVKRRKDL